MLELNSKLTIKSMEVEMRKSFFVFVFFLLYQLLLFGSDYVDVVYLKNGDIAKGVIIENVPNEYVKLEIQGGTILTFNYADIEKFGKEKNIKTDTDQSTYSSANSQFNINSIQKGIKAGFNMGKFIGDDSDLDDNIDPKYALGFTLGGFFSLKLHNSFIIRPELLYTMKGSRYEESEDGETYKMIFKMNYLDCCILGIVPLQNNINLIFGPSIGFYLNGEIKASYDGDTESEDIEKDDLNSPDFGLIFGGSYNITPNIEIEPRYYLGLKSWEESDEWDIKHSALQLIINYSF